ncbi:hypothetical protein [Providencia alcalifaciens]|nr:hypothetical protein [Providencia alcalifaciens]
MNDRFPWLTPFSVTHPQVGTYYGSISIVTTFCLFPRIQGN